ncbi:PTS lactose transporter subunit IIC [Leuconostoc citreum]|uniref:PTS lactose transporter subunit IIC n=1 Tax=Leuconostoc citreum TaxID=33964 RepID=A0A5A5TYV9_LEUCI|nr:PTS sugar transporter subunit IIC [Leuconostoc citreum]GDZ83319.1 PTS lactose transporter subunit IIC [Leuconostoc citreum]
MLKTLVNQSQRWDNIVYQHATMQAVKTALQQLRPILVIDVYAHLLFRLIFAPDNFIGRMVDNYPPITKVISNHMRIGLTFLDAAIVMIFVIALTQHYLTTKGITNTSLPILTNFIAIYLLLVGKNQIPTYNTTQYLLMSVTVLFSVTTYCWFQKKWVNPDTSPYAYRYLVWAVLIILMSWLLRQLIAIPHFQTTISVLLSKTFFTTFWGLLAVSILSPLLFVFGFALPSELTDDQTTLNTVIANLDAVLSTGHKVLPYPENLYSTYGAFTLFGGIGNTLVISLLLLFATSRKHQKLGLITWFPSLFDDSTLLLAGVPLFLRPLMLVPMLLVSVISQLIGYVAIATHFIQPVVYPTPMNIPNLLLPTIASTTPIRSTLVTVAVFILSIVIYRPFVHRLTEGVSYEK